MKSEIMLGFILVTIIILFEVYVDRTYQKFYEMQYTEEVKTLHEAYNLASQSEKEGNIYGLYFSDNGFFVRTEGSKAWEINETIYHEACHYYVEKDYAHFCEGKI